MEITLITISKQCADIINKCTVELDENVLIIGELYDKIYDIYPSLDVEDYTLYWWYSKDRFHKVCDYITYFAAMKLMVERILLLVLHDSDEYCEDNEIYLKELDVTDLKEARRTETDPYDVVAKDSMEGLDVGPPLTLRTDPDILNHALRNFPEPKYYISDLMYRMNSAECIKKGWAKQKNVLTLLGDETIERTPPKGQDPKKKK
ncbi:hypothetical protein RI129_003555 [Pyrocoelia pectoralis]|uniref:Uncharacterized protein n=1 Tax=Pyrocoelia pectoralis TaxID=417401 RepID=A0AAN7VQQ9_9COLE